MVKKVKMYTTPTCSFCRMEKAFLRENNIPFEEIDVTKDHEALEEMVEKTGQMGVPVTDIDGQVIVGFDKARIKKALGLN